VVAAKRAIARGYEVKKGDKIGYVIVKGPERLSRRAWPWFLVQEEMIDHNYYIEHQVIPAAMRILGYFGVTEAKLRGGSTGLWRFLKK
jgi:DNA polymerase I